MSPNWLGRAVALHATSSGKAFLAWLPKEERRRPPPGEARALHRRLRSPIGGSLEEEFEAVRRDGYSICVGELEETLYGASAAVLNERERPVAIVSVWGPQHRVPAERLPEIGRRAKAAAGEIEALLA